MVAEAELLDVSDGPVPSAVADLAPVAQVAGDAQLLELWLHGCSAHTQRAYRTDSTDAVPRASNKT